MIIQDLLASNANALISELTGKLSRLQDVLLSAEPGGDFAETIMAQIDITTRALSAAHEAFDGYK
jgi:hypothetical protein